MTGEVIHVDEASRRTGRAQATIRSYMREFPEISPKRAHVDFDKLQQVIARKVSGDLRAINRVRSRPFTDSGMIGDSATPGVADQIAETRLRKEEATLQKIEIANARTAGLLVRLDDAESILTGIIQAARQRLEAIPGRLAPQLEGRSKPQIEAALAGEIEAALGQLSDGLTTIAEAFA